jgi:porin
LGLTLNMTAAVAPVSAWGGGVAILPWKGAKVSVSVLDPNGMPTENGFEDAFDGGILLGAEGRVTIKPFGLVGHQLIGFMWSNKEGPSLFQDPSNLARLLITPDSFPRLSNPGRVLQRILERFFPELLVPVQPLNTEGSFWTLYYNFDQYLWSPQGHPDRGVGVFFRFGVSDGLANAAGAGESAFKLSAAH